MAQLNVPITFTENSAFNSQNNSTSYGINRIEQLINSDLFKIETNLTHMEMELNFMMRDKKTKIEFESTMIMLLSMLRGDLQLIRSKQIVLDSVTTTTHTIKTDTF